MDAEMEDSFQQMLMEVLSDGEEIQSIAHDLDLNLYKAQPVPPPSVAAGLQLALPHGLAGYLNPQVSQQIPPAASTAGAPPLVYQRATPAPPPVEQRTEAAGSKSGKADKQQKPPQAQRRPRAWDSSNVRNGELPHNCCVCLCFASAQ